MKPWWKLAFFATGAVCLTTACGHAPGPDAVLKQYLADWSRQDYKAMYGLLSAAAQKRITEADFAQRYQTITSGIDTESLVAAEGTTSSNDSKGQSTKIPFKATWKTAITDPFTEPYSATLVKDKDGWRIDWQPNLIFPQLQTGWKVHAQSEEPTRGQIVSADGKPLAVNVPGKEIGFVPGKMKSTSVANLAKTLGLSAQNMKAELHQAWVKPDLFVPMKTLPAAAEKGLEPKLLQIPGVLITDSPNPVRSYPLGSSAAHVVGYLGPITAQELTAQRKQEGYTASDMMGQQGLERQYETQLRGQMGGKVWVSDANGGSQTVLAQKQPVAGDNITVTLDSQVQTALANALGHNIGSAVVLDPATGAVLGMASYPTFDPNQLTQGVSASVWKGLLNDPKAPLVNRALSAIPPGSSLKPLVAGIGLTKGVLKPTTTFPSDPLHWQKDSSWGTYSVTREPHPSGTVDLLHALVWSDNVYFAQVGLAIGADAFVKGLDGFGFGQPLHFALPIEKAQVSNDGAIHSQVQLADSAYGQGQVLVSPLQLASMYTAYLNQGDVLAPYLIKEEDAASGKIVSSHPSKTVLAKGVISSSAVNQIVQDLRQVVADPAGTAHAISSVPGWTVSGKTGTAQKKRGGSDWGWFASWGNQPGHSQPKYLVVMALANTQNIGGSHYTVEQVRKFYGQMH